MVRRALRLKEGKKRMREENSFFKIACENAEREITETTGQTVNEWKGQAAYITSGFSADAEKYNAKRTSTGLPSIDKMTGGGLAGGRVYVLAGIAGSGKTTLALQIAHVIAKTQKVLYIAYEQSRFELTAKAIASHAGKTVEDIITENEAERTRHANEYAREAGDGLEIVEAGRRTSPEEIERRANGAALVVFDYLQIMPRGSEQTAKDGADHNITLAKNIAIHTGAAVIVISAMNRASYASAVGGRNQPSGDERRAALLSGMKESGGIEYTADFVGVIESADAENTKLQIVKNRYGQTGEAALIFEKDKGKISSPDAETKKTST